jgi:hypothetical protein
MISASEPYPSLPFDAPSFIKELIFFLGSIIYNKRGGVSKPLFKHCPFLNWDPFGLIMIAG